MSGAGRYSCFSLRNSEMPIQERAERDLSPAVHAGSSILSTGCTFAASGGQWRHLQPDE